MQVAVLHLHAAVLHRDMETRGMQGDAAHGGGLHVQMHLAAQCLGCEPGSFQVEMQVQVALQRLLVQQGRQVDMRQCQAAAIAPRCSDGIELPVQVELASRSTELAAHAQSVRRSLGGQGEGQQPIQVLPLQQAPQLCHVKWLHVQCQAGWLAAAWEDPVSRHQRLCGLQAERLDSDRIGIALDGALHRVQHHLGRGSTDGQRVHLEAEAVRIDLTLEVGLQPCERLHAGQGRGLHHDLASVDLDTFHHDRHWQLAACGACRCRRTPGRQQGVQHAVDIPRPPGLLHQRCLGAHDVHTLDDALRSYLSCTSSRRATSAPCRSRSTT